MGRLGGEVGADDLSRSSEVSVHNIRWKVHAIPGPEAVRSHLTAVPDMIAEPGKKYAFRKLPSEGQTRTGAYKALVEGGHDLVELHALMAPRPSQAGQRPRGELNEKWLGPKPRMRASGTVANSSRTGVNRPT